MARKNDGLESALGLLGLVVLVIGLIAWAIPYILRALAFILGALYSFCIKYKKEIWRVSWECFIMGGSISLAGYICDINNYTVAFSDILMLLLAVSFWFLFRSSALQLQEDYKISQENSTIEKHTEIRIQNNVTKEIENAQILRNQMNTNYDIDIMTCSKEDMLTLAGFNKDKAAKFINLRACGKIWYDEDEFYKDFGLKPHEIIYAQKRLKFPPKPNLKNGRTVDI